MRHVGRILLSTSAAPGPSRRQSHVAQLNPMKNKWSLADAAESGCILGG